MKNVSEIEFEEYMDRYQSDQAAELEAHYNMDATPPVINYFHGEKIIGQIINYRRWNIDKEIEYFIQ